MGPNPAIRGNVDTETDTAREDEMKKQGEIQVREILPQTQGHRRLPADPGVVSHSPEKRPTLPTP